MPDLYWKVAVIFGHESDKWLLIYCHFTKD